MTPSNSAQGDVLAASILDICQMRFPADRTISQCLTTPTSLVRRVNLIRQDHDLRGKRLLCVGDDDFTSLALAIDGELGSATVLDIDDRILHQLQKIASARNFSLTAIKYDVRSLLEEKMPLHLGQAFDLAVTDPPPTVDGTKLFLAAAVQGLKIGGCLYHAAPFDPLLNWTTELLLEAESFLLANGFVITHLEPFFHEYELDTAVRSAMLVAKKVRHKELNLGTMNGLAFFYPSRAVI